MLVNLAQSPSGGMYSANSKRVKHRPPAALAQPHVLWACFWFDVSPSIQRGREERQEGGNPRLRSPTQSLFKADNLCFTKRSLILLMKTKSQRPHTTNKTNHNEWSWAASSGGRSGPGEREWVRARVLRAGWQCLFLEEAQVALGCSRWLFLQTS